MPGVKIICSICTDEFVRTDDIYSTSCGHLYHYACMMQWQSRSTSCPQCREHNPTNHKVFLNFEDPVEPSAPPADDDLNIKLESSVEKIFELQAQLQESELNFLHLQEQYTIEQNARKQLDRTVAQSNDNDTNFLSLHAQYSESENRFKILQEENERLSVENEYKSKELALRATEISMLNKSLAEVKHSSSSDTIANARIDILEQKLRHVTDELQKQISNSTQLAIDKMKLQSYIQRMEMHGNLTSATIISRPPECVIRSRENSQNVLNIPPVATVRQDLGESKLDSSSVLLQNFPLEEIRGSLEEMVISIAAKIDIIITKDDIVNVKMLNAGVRKPSLNTITVYVQFKTDDLKFKFLTNRGSLKKYAAFSKVGIKEFIDKKVHALFMYANKKLHGKVFGYIACINNKIIAKKYRADINFITIHSTEQVDDLLKTYLLPKNEPSTYLQEDKIDECFYKIS